MKHLGFKWGFKGKALTLDRHNESRVSEMWATTSSLISCGIRWAHPNTISNIFKTLIILKVLYGIEITDVNKFFELVINKQCRNSLKSLWGVSKHSRNDLNKYYDLADISNTIKARKINYLQQLMRNKTTRKYLTTLLTLKNRSFSTLQNTFNLAQKDNIDLLEILFGKKMNISSMDTLDDGKKWYLITFYLIGTSKKDQN